MGRRILVWMIALSGMLQSGGEAVAAAILGQGEVALTWLAFTVAVAIVAVCIERIKFFLEA